MQKLRNMTEDEMVLAFVKAEAGSPIWGAHYAQYAQALGHDLGRLVQAMDATDAGDNLARAELLGRMRGYKRDDFLFGGFPNDTAWSEASIDHSELGDLWYANYGPEIWSSTGSRAVRDSKHELHRFATDKQENFKGISAAVLSNQSHQPLIVVGQSDGSQLILLEGHTRATAYFSIGKPDKIVLIIGISPEMSKWRYWKGR
jgi:hypothetical protein